MNRYENGKIYKITCNENNLVYYGSTCMPLRKRLLAHRKKYRFFLKNGGNFTTSFDIIKYNSAKIELVEDFKCNKKLELLTRERYYIENNECCNKNIPGRTKEEYYIDNLDKLKEKMKQYRENNKDKIKQYIKQHYIDNKDKLKKYNKQYRIDNKDKIKQYYISNKDMRKQQRKQYQQLKYNCMCGSICSIADKSKHYKTKKHKLYIFNLHNELNHL